MNSQFNRLDEHNENQMIALARDGDIRAVELLYSRHVILARRIGGRRGLSTSESDTVLGDCLERCIASFRPERGPFVSYLATSISNEITGQNRRHHAFWRHLMPGAAPGHHDMTFDLPDSRPTPEDHALDGADLVLTALGSLPADECFAVNRLAVDGAPIELVAFELGCSKKRVDNLYQRGKKHLADLLPGEMSDGRTHRRRRIDGSRRTTRRGPQR
jgi:DNA-directed RNA polymerase specialized sigma24 family protein